MPLNEIQERLCSESPTDFSDLKAIAFNCSLKRRAAESHTRLLLSVSEEILQRGGVAVEHIHLAEHRVPYGIYPDMTEHGWESDDWPNLWEQVKAADILIVGTPIWLGEESSLCRILIERLYGMSGLLNDRGQSVFYSKVGGAVMTGNEDGVKHCAMTILYALGHLGYTIPERVHGKPAGFDNDFPQRNTSFMTWNLMHLARLLKDAGGIPNHGNDRKAWDAGCRFGYDNPDYRA